MEPPRLLIQDACGFAGSWRDVHFDVWHAAANAAQMSAHFGTQTSLIASRPSGTQIITVTVVHEGAIKQLDADVRRALDENIARSLPHVKASAIILKAPGFKGAFVRSIIATVTLFSGAKYPSKTASDEESAFRWAEPFLERDNGIAVSGNDLLAAYQALLALRTV